MFLPALEMPFLNQANLKYFAVPQQKFLVRYKCTKLMLLRSQIYSQVPVTNTHARSATMSCQCVMTCKSYEIHFILNHHKNNLKFNKVLKFQKLSSMALKLFINKTVVQWILLCSDTCWKVHISYDLPLAQKRWRCMVLQWKSLLWLLRVQTSPLEVLCFALCSKQSCPKTFFLNKVYFISLLFGCRD